MTAQCKHNFYAHWETKKVTWLALPWYALCCGGLELCLRVTGTRACCWCWHVCLTSSVFAEGQPRTVGTRAPSDEAPSSRADRHWNNQSPCDPLFDVEPWPALPRKHTGCSENTQRETWPGLVCRGRLSWRTWCLNRTEGWNWVSGRRWVGRVPDGGNRIL